MSDTTILRDKNPSIADFVDQWNSRYERTFDLKDEAQQANLYEAVMEMARHVATVSEKASLKIEVTNDGVTQIVVNATPSTSPTFDGSNCSDACS